jgi:hypothetical protein
MLIGERNTTKVYKGQKNVLPIPAKPEQNTRRMSMNRTLRALLTKAGHYLHHEWQWLAAITPN